MTGRLPLLKSDPALLRKPAAMIIIAVMAASSEPSAAVDAPVVWTIGGHSRGIIGVAASPDGTMAASASPDGTAKIWRLSDGRLLRTFEAPGLTGIEMTAVAFSPDSRRILAGGGGGGYEFDLSNGALLTTLAGLESAGFVAYSRDGVLCASGSSGSGLEELTLIYNCHSGELLHLLLVQELRLHYGGVFAADGQTFVTASGGNFGPGGPGSLRFWSMADGQNFRTITEPAARFRGLARSLDGQTLAVAGGDGQVRLYAMSDGALLDSLVGHTNESVAVEFSPDGERLASSADDGTVRIWNYHTGHNLLTIPAHSGPAGSVAWLPDDDAVLSGGGDPFNATDTAALRWWDAGTGALQREFLRHAATQAGGGYSPGRSWYLSSDWFGTVVVSDAITGEEIRRRDVTEPAAGLISDAAISPNGEHAALSLHGGLVRLLDAETLDGVRDHIPLPAVASDVEFSPDSSRLCAAFGSAGVRVWNVADGSLHAQLTGSAANAFAVRPLPDGSGDLIVFAASAVRRLTSPGGMVVWTRPLTGGVNAVALSADGALAAAGRSNGHVLLIDADSGAEIRTIAAHATPVAAAALSTDGTVLLSADGLGDRFVKAWRTLDGALLRIFDAESAVGAVRLDFLGSPGRIALARRDGAVVALVNDGVVIAGDADCDGLLTAADAGRLAAALLEGAPGDEPCSALRADVNGDGRLDGLDIQAFVTLVSA